MKNGLPQMLCFLQTAVCKVVVVFGNGHSFSQFSREILEKNIHITAQGVLFILVCLRLWRNIFRGQLILVFCDNMVAYQVINTGRSRCEILQAFLREICFFAATFEFELRAKHLEAVNNLISDHLSRWHFDIRHEESFLKLTSEFNLIEYPVEDDHFKLLNDW